MPPTPNRLLTFQFVTYLRQKPQFLLALGLGILVLIGCQVFTHLRIVTDVLLAWNTFTIFYLIIGVQAMLTADHETLQQHAHLYDDGERTILIFSILAAALGIVGIVAELATGNTVTGAIKAFHIVLAILTLMSSWAYIHLSFAFHYAHGYYVQREGKTGGCLIFPGTDKPNYSDFLYFSYVIGTSGQTADVDFASTAMRRIGLVHCVVSYVFNAAVLGLTINIAASLIAK